MFTFTNSNIIFAKIEDIPVIELLLNSAYRGWSSTEGWTTEFHLIEGETRTNKEVLQQVMNQKKNVFLKYKDADNSIAGCVNLHQIDTTIHLGMFAVLPHLQTNGIGKQLLQVAEEYAYYLQCPVIDLSVISVRTELIEWYKRRGYKDTGERIFFKEDAITGKHLQRLEFMTMEKRLLEVSKGKD